MIDLVLDPLGYDIFLRSLLAVVMVGIVCAVVGTYVVLKGLAFIGDAISHAAFPGVVAAYILGGSFFIGAAIAAVSTALATRYITRRGDLRSDTSIGVLFAGMFALGIFLFSTIRGYVGDLFAFLVGNVLAISPTDLVALVVLAIATLAIVAVLWKELLYATFDPLGAAASGLKVEALEYLFLALVAMTIVISLQAVGIILVVAMLVTPPAAAQLLTVRFGRLVGLAVAISVAVIGGRPVPQLLARRRERGDHRPHPDRRLPGGPVPRAASRPAVAAPAGRPGPGRGMTATAARRLRKAGHRVTSQRLAVADALAASPRQVTAQELWERMRPGTRPSAGRPSSARSRPSARPAWPGASSGTATSTRTSPAARRITITCRAGCAAP